MIDLAKIEGYLIKLNLSFSEVARGTWLIQDPEKGLEQVFVIVEDPLVIIRVKVMETPKTNREAFFEELLKLNASDIISGAYALEDEHVILIDTLMAQTLDLEEIQASLDAVSLALTQHYPILSEFRK